MRFPRGGEGLRDEADVGGGARGYVAPYDSWHNRLAVHRFIQDIPLQAGDRAFDVVANTEKSLAGFRKIPMLICWGMKDFVFRCSFSESVGGLFPDAEVHRFADAGHYVLEDAGVGDCGVGGEFFAQASGRGVGDDDDAIGQHCIAPDGDGAGAADDGCDVGRSAAGCTGFS